MEQEFNIDFPIAPHEHVIDFVVECTQEMMAEKLEAIIIVSPSPVTMVNNFQ